MNEGLRSVLLVDDEVRNLELIAAVLEHQGFQPTLAHTPKAAMELLRTLRFDAVVTDVVFDGFSEGAAVLAAARELQPRAVVVLMTGYPQIEGAVSAIKAGAHDYIQKPVDPILLSAFLHRALKEREIERDNPEFRLVEDITQFLTHIYSRGITEHDEVTVVHFSEVIEFPPLD